MRSFPPGIALAALLTLLSSTSCGARIDRGSTLTLAVDSGPASLDPRLGSDEASRRVNDLLYNGLFRIDAEARAVPDLALSFERPDDRTVTVHLRPDVRFHDGHHLTADDVVYTYRSILTNEVPSFRRADLDVLTSVSAEDSQTVVFRLARPFAPILGNLNIPILAAGAGPGVARRPNGTGPFRLQRYRKDEDLILSRFAESFEGPAGVETVRLRIIPSETARLLEILKGSVDMIVNDLSPDQLRRLQATPGIEVHGVAGRNCVYMAFNLEDPILRDPRIRRAFALAIDRPSIVAYLLHGRAALATGLLPPGHWAYEEDVRRYPPDPVAAGRLLDEAGHPDPDGDGPAPRFRMTYKTTTSELAQQQAAIIQQQLARVGVDIVIRAYEWGTSTTISRPGGFKWWCPTGPRSAIPTSTDSASIQPITLHAASTVDITPTPRSTASSTRGRRPAPR